MNRMIEIEENIRPLTIGLIGYNKNTTHKGMVEILKNNINDIKYVSRDCLYISLKDETQIIPIFENGNMHRGRKFDQLILFDDKRWEIKTHKMEQIDLFVSYYMNYSCVPDEYKIIEFEDIT